MKIAKYLTIFTAGILEKTSYSHGVNPIITINADANATIASNGALIKPIICVL